MGYSEVCIFFPYDIFHQSILRQLELFRSQTLTQHLTEKLLETAEQDFLEVQRGHLDD